jgi:hypothetical protein
MWTWTTPFGGPTATANRAPDGRFSVTARMDPAVSAAIASIDEAAWTPIRNPKAVWDDDEQRWISDAEVAEVPFTAFTSPAQGRACHRPVDRAPGQTAEPDQRLR